VNAPEYHRQHHQVQIHQLLYARIREQICLEKYNVTTLRGRFVTCTRHTTVDKSRSKVQDAYIDENVVIIFYDIEIHSHLRSSSCHVHVQWTALNSIKATLRSNNSPSLNKLEILTYMIASTEPKVALERVSV